MHVGGGICCGLGQLATGVTAASVCNLGILAWHDMNACIDEMHVLF